MQSTSSNLSEHGCENVFTLTKTLILSFRFFKAMDDFMATSEAGEWTKFFFPFFLSGTLRVW